MGIKKLNNQNILFSKVQQRLLAVLYGRPDIDFHTNEIIRLTDVGSGAIQRELVKFTAAGLITMKCVGNQKRYQANPQSLLFSELRSIVMKTFGLATVLKKVLHPLAKKILIAFIYGSIAKQQDSSNSDIDLMIISEHNLTYVDLFHLLEKAEKQLSRTVNPTFYSPLEWTRKYKDGNNFIQQISQQSKIFIIGDENEFGKLR